MCELKALLAQLVTDITSLQQFLDDSLAPICIVYFPLNFLISAGVSYLSYPVMLRMDDKLLQHILRMSVLHGKAKPYKWFFFYALTTGIASTTLIAFQFKRLEVPTAFLYGLLGPYALMDRIKKTFEGRAREGLNNEYKETIDIPIKDYGTEIDRVKFEIAKEIEKKLHGKKKGGDDESKSSV